MQSLIIFLSLLVAVIRPFLIFHTLGKHAQKSYEAVAHLLVGALIASWYILREDWLLHLWVGLSVIEIISAVITVVRKRRGVSNS